MTSMTRAKNLTIIVRTPREQRQHQQRALAARLAGASCLIAAILVPSPLQAITGWLPF